MDERGFFPAHGCRGCGTALQGLGEGRPAELYAGTYTGYCYKCRDREGYQERCERMDGAVWWNYPPSNPSYRNDREHNLAYLDCVECNGTGFHWKRDASGFSRYRASCDTCWARWRSHPVRMWHSENHRGPYERAEAKFQARLKQMKLYTKNKKHQLSEEEIASVKEVTVEIYGWYREQQLALTEQYLQRQLEAAALFRQEVVTL